ncbi:MAG: 16S rRNA (cytosine(967)-C(5))-methyltransferase RsmB [Chlorobi bacterium]|nr:MAG: 16S rRNA (cytosine(967)-C(5))-methyltransferase RsmB [Bacteroidota bacterium]KXK34695.1 MAG: ribosomal RNA small subunit methyltransferase B [Chlorobi bacterium OLB6]MBE2264967.1 16S rRNA (cytosine(967)-C(5))-methyltransferase RsmB [Flavobacteriales bacterium]MBL1160996.1 16S rRNA (cytosine(967)-C(5))-methyltransferase RsmB [Chlorobiota bacterium]MBW7852954.1 16S rRNA (cytosine(967)-C(5))-methyltransferase RsmB [Candidatus Kapabacteria bacterium]MCC6330794.1 16S rRNA (cytosine(967)-C(5
MSNEQAPSSQTSTADRETIAPLSLFETARGTAVKILMRYESSDSYIDKLLDAELRRSELAAADKALVTELVNGTVRWLSRLDWILTGFYHGEFTKCLALVRNSMRIALYQMLFLSKIPPPAAINESVEIVKRYKGDRHAGIVNGVLRNVQRSIGNIRYPPREENELLHLSVHSAHPLWMVRRYVERFGAAQAEALLNANNQRPMLTLRTHATRFDVNQLVTILDAEQIKYEASSVHQASVLVTSLRDIRSLSVFADGLVSVQDASASLVVRLANPKPGMLVYDLCAAPGSKAVFAAEIMNNEGLIIALDQYSSKLQAVRDNARRAQVNIVEARHGDAREFSPEKQADIVLVDAPCSGLGTLSKKPDIKWRRSVDDIRRMAKRQAEILSHAATLVKVEGALVYSTCTIEPEENQDVIAGFLREYPNFELDPAEKHLAGNVCKDGFMQTFPHIHHCDGAFGARLIRKR